MDQTPDFNKVLTLRELLIDELSDLYDAERQLVDILPKMAEAAQNENLRLTFQEHTERTKIHLARLEHAFILLDAPSSGRKSQGMEGLVSSELVRMQENALAAIRDAALIGGAQKMEHYGIAGYGTLRTFAELLGNEEIAELLQQTLMDKFRMDRSLTALASKINVEVARLGAN
ncbi:MAG: ferritin-like domain-containing protein [Nibricoccus sp.]